MPMTSVRSPNARALPPGSERVYRRRGNTGGTLTTQNSKRKTQKRRHEEHGENSGVHKKNGVKALRCHPVFLSLALCLLEFYSCVTGRGGSGGTIAAAGRSFAGLGSRGAAGV